MTREQFIAIVSDEQESLRRFLLALCGGDRMEAEDIAQEAMIKAYVALDRFMERAKFSTWLFKIAYNTFLDHQRSPKRREVDLEKAVQFAGTFSADESFQYQDLYEALGTLPAKEKSALLLFYLNGYSVKEISKITGNSQMAVKKQLSRGREKLRKTLRQ